MNKEIDKETNKDYNYIYSTNIDAPEPEPEPIPEPEPEPQPEPDIIRMYYGNKTYLKNTTDYYGAPYYTTNVEEAAVLEVNSNGEYEWLQATNLTGNYTQKINIRFDSAPQQIRFNQNLPKDANDANLGVTFSEVVNNGFLFVLLNPTTNTGWYLENVLSEPEPESYSGLTQRYYDSGYYDDDLNWYDDKSLSLIHI